MQASASMSQEIKHIPLDLIVPSPFQARKVFNQEALGELADSMLDVGQIQPATVRPLENGKYELVAGERRWRAAGLAALAWLDCIVRNMSDKEAAKIVIVENLQREDLNPMEEVRGLAKLKVEHGLTQEEIAEQIGMSRSKLANKLRLLQLHPKVQAWVADLSLAETCGRALASLEQGRQLEIASKAVKGNWSLKRVESAIKALKPAENASDSADMARLNRLISEQVGATANVTHTKGKGSLVLSYDSLDALEGILDKLGVKYDP